MQNFRLISVGVGWLTVSMVSFLGSGFNQSVFYCMGWVKPFVCLSIWVGAMMFLASAPNFINSDSWFCVSVSSLTVFLLLALTSSSLVSFYYFFESTLLPTLFLIYGWGNQPERLQAAMYLLIYTVLGSLPLLFALSVLVDQGWGLTYGVWSVFTGIGGSSFFFSSFLWFSVMGALLIKLPMYPVHLWLPKAHVEAPLAGSMALAGILLKLGVFGVVMLGQLVAFPVGAASFILGLSLWGSVVTSVICVRQTDMKSLIAYSSIGHMGLALGGLLSGSELGIKGAIVVAVAHGLSSPAMLSFASIVYDVTFSRSIFLCKGAGNLFPIILLPLLLLCAANMSAPPFVNLVGEIWLIISVSAFSSWTSVMIGLMCLLVGAYTLYLYTAMSHGTSSSFSSASHLYSSSNYLILFMQCWPMFVLMLNLSILF